jgi:DNA-binding transcriptional LysR family regulator
MAVIGPSYQSDQACLTFLFGMLDLPDPHPGGELLAGPELAAFVSAFETGTLQGAADELALTQSAVTKRIQSLERRLGARVFERGRSGVRPTPLGQTIYPPAKQALVALAEVVRAARVGRDLERTDLRLCASHTIGEYLLPGWLTEFRRRAPGIHPQLEVINSTGTVRAVREGRAAIGFVEGRDPLPDLDVITIAHDTLAVVVSSTHRWARRRALSPRDLLTEPYLTREAASGTRSVAGAALESVGVRLVPALEAASTQSLKRALAGGGFTIISRRATVEEEHAATHVALPVRGVEFTRELRALRRRRPALTGLARLFWEWLQTPSAHTQS